MTSKDTWIENLQAQNDALKAERDHALAGEAYANGFGLAAVDAWEARALKAEADLSSLRTEQERLKEALKEIRLRTNYTASGIFSVEEQLTTAVYAIERIADAALTLPPRQP